MRMTPFLPQRGKQPRGSIPLTPCFVGVFHQPSDSYRTMWGCPGGGGSKHDVKKSPQERMLVPLWDFNRAHISQRIEKVSGKKIIFSAG